jgi:hypothetical protein
MVDFIKCQIKMTNLTYCKSQWPLSMVNLIKLNGHFDGPLTFLTIWMFDLLHGQNVILGKCFSQIICVSHALLF